MYIDHFSLVSIVFPLRLKNCLKICFNHNSETIGAKLKIFSRADSLRQGLHFQAQSFFSISYSFSSKFKKPKFCVFLQFHRFWTKQYRFFRNVRTEMQNIDL